MAEIVKLDREYTLSGKKYTEIVLDFEELGGNDLIVAEKEYKKRNKGAAVKELEDGWAITVASKASGIRYGDLLNLKGKDYMRGLNRTKGFLNSGLESVEDEDITEKENIEEIMEESME